MSEATKKRGRPAAFDAEWYRQCKMLSPDIRTRRGIINQMYCSKGYGIVKDMQGMDYIKNDATQTIKVCILTELGRLNDEQAAREAATFICGQEAAGDHRTAHEWAAIVRHWRLTRHDKQI